MPVSSVTLLSAGPLTAEFEAGNLRNIRWHGLEAIRAISYLVRDENWGNYPLEISGLETEQSANAFHLSFNATVRSKAGTRLAVAVGIEGFADGRLIFDVIAIAEGDFRTNRCGFCILHPIVGIAGSPVTVEHVDGTIEEAHFPDVIDPAQPFMEMRAITHRVAEGVTAECRMEGGTFEMEDQRNWTDASYKTYVRPLALPWPYVIADGETDHQTITLILKGMPQTAGVVESAAPLTLAIGPALGSLPAFGLGLRPADMPATMQHLDALRAIAPRHLILHFNPLEGHGLADLKAYAALLEAFPAAATLEFVLPCGKTRQKSYQPWRARSPRAVSRSRRSPSARRRT